MQFMVEAICVSLLLDDENDYNCNNIIDNTAFQPNYACIGVAYIYHHCVLLKFF